MPCSATNKLASLLLLPWTSLSPGLAQPDLPAKEVLNYAIEWRLITAGKARLAWSAARDEDHGGWQTTLHVESTGMVSKLFRVKDDYTSLLNPELCAISSQMTAEEGRRRRETKITYDSEARKASYLEKDLVKNSVVAAHEIDIPACVHDVFGALYLLRTLRVEPGQSTQVALSDGKKSVSARIEAQQRETVKTPAGTFKTIRYEAFVFNNVLYRRSARLYFWLTDDRRKVPVQIRVKLQFTIGTITLQLEKEQQT